MDLLVKSYTVTTISSSCFSNVNIMPDLVSLHYLGTAPLWWVPCQNLPALHENILRPIMLYMDGLLKSHEELKISCSSTWYTFLTKFNILGTLRRVSFGELTWSLLISLQDTVPPNWCLIVFHYSCRFAWIKWLHICGGKWWFESTKDIGSCLFSTVIHLWQFMFVHVILVFW